MLFNSQNHYKYSLAAKYSYDIFTLGSANLTSMSDKSLKLQISIPPVEGIEDVPVAAVEALASKMGFEPDRVQDIVQALTEACVNAILYSTSDSDVEVLVTAMHNGLVLEVHDRGSGFNPDLIKPPNFELMSEIGVKNGGFGIHMIRELVDKVEIESSEKGTIVRMSTFLTEPNTSAPSPDSALDPSSLIPQP